MIRRCAISAILLSVMFTGCSRATRVRREMRSYVGRSIQEAIAEWGPPHHIWERRSQTYYIWLWDGVQCVPETGFPLDDPENPDCGKILRTKDGDRIFGWGIKGCCETGRGPWNLDGTRKPDSIPPKKRPHPFKPVYR